MNSLILLIAVLLPFVGGALMFGMKTWSYKKLQWFCELLVIATSILVWVAILFRPMEEFLCFNLTGNLSIILKLDSFGSIFAGMVSLLWPLANLYAFEYMHHDEKRRSTFFGFYTMTYGVTLGIAFAGNMLTLYFFYEVLTLVTFYLVMHPMTKKAVRASRMYLYYSLGGAAFAFLSIVCLIIYGDSTNFVLGGVLNPEKIGAHVNQILILFVLAFCGFGVKAALFPFHSWLPKASVAPTPVTALLHAVAVVKSGAFAILRLIYYSYGVEVLRGTWAQDVVMILCMITILYGSGMAVKETHIKRRLAFSTVSNLSYVLLGAAFMSPAGMAAAIIHMIVHAFMKITGFFCVGTVMVKTNRNYMSEIEGLGRKMPVVFICLTVAGLSLTGIPPFGGFISKWFLAEAALLGENPLGILAVAVLLLSALLTAIYMGQMVVKGWFPRKEANLSFTAADHDPGWQMQSALIVFTLVVFALGVGAKPLMELINAVAFGNL